MYFPQWKSNYIEAANACPGVNPQIPRNTRSGHENFEFAKRLTAYDQAARAIDLTGTLLKETPNTPLKAQIEVARAEWRGKAGQVLPENLDDLSARTDKELKILDLTAPGTIRVLATEPKSFNVIRVAQSCTAEQFGSERRSFWSSGSPAGASLGAQRCPGVFQHRAKIA